MNKWFILALIFSWLACLTAGYKFKDYEDRAAQEEVEAQKAKNLGKGSANIINGNQKLDGELSNVKDPCLSTRLPADLKQLR
jgi:hypothetical protein